MRTFVTMNIRKNIKLTATAIELLGAGACLILVCADVFTRDNNIYRDVPWQVVAIIAGVLLGSWLLERGWNRLRIESVTTQQLTPDPCTVPEESELCGFEADQTTDKTKHRF